MCLAVPGKVISINSDDPELKMAKVQFGGIIQDICVQWIDDLRIGDYIIAHVGVALNRIDEEDARFTLDALYDMGGIDFNSD